MLNLRSIRFVVMAAQSRSFRSAAEILGVEQSALSRTIQSLEDNLGVSLFERHSGGVRLTKAGQRFSEIASRILADVELLRDEAESAGEAKSGSLAIGVDLPLAKGKLTALIGEHQRRHRNVDIRLVEDTRGRLSQGLIFRHVDIAIVSGALRDRSFEIISIWKKPLVIALQAAHSLERKQNIQIDDLATQMLIFNRSDIADDIQNLLKSEFVKIGKRPKIRIHDASAETIRSLVGLGQGLTCLIESCDPTDRYIVRRPLFQGKSRCALQFYACWDHRNDNPALRRFVSLLKARYASPRPKSGSA